jgi:hypothetical protein
VGSNPIVSTRRDQGISGLPGRHPGSPESPGEPSGEPTCRLGSPTSPVSSDYIGAAPAPTVARARGGRRGRPYPCCRARARRPRARAARPPPTSATQLSGASRTASTARSRRARTPGGSTPQARRVDRPTRHRREHERRAVPLRARRRAPAPRAASQGRANLRFARAFWDTRAFVAAGAEPSIWRGRGRQERWSVGCRGEPLGGRSGIRTVRLVTARYPTLG